MSKLEYKSFKVLELKADPAAHSVYGYAATYDLDNVEDRITPGAFAKSLKKRFIDRLAAGRAPYVKMLEHHDTTKPVGIPVTLYEDGHGLWVVAKISNTQRGNELITLLLDGVIDTMSIGYKTIKYHMEGPIRVLDEIDIYEISFIVFAANDEAMVESVKYEGVVLETKNYAIKCTEEDMNIEAKAGQMLSRANADKLLVAVNEIRTVLSAAGLWQDSPVDLPEAEASEHVSTEEAGVPATTEHGVNAGEEVAGTYTPANALGYDGTSYDPQRTENPANYHKAMCPHCDQEMPAKKEDETSDNDKKDNVEIEDNSNLNELISVIRNFTL